MAGSFAFDLVSPERRLASLQVTEVQIPGAEGDLTAMLGHAPLITTLRPGVLRANAQGGGQAYAVTGGFAEISATTVTVLAERAIPLAEVTAALLEGFIAEARSRLDEGPADRAMAEKTLADMIALKASLAA